MGGSFDSQGMVTYVAVGNPLAFANTSILAPGQSGTFLGSQWLWGVNIRIPPGHAGLTGLAIYDSGQSILPWDPTNSTWITGDDDDLDFVYDKQVGANTAFFFYNASTLYNHAWQVRFVYTPLSLYTGSAGVGITTPDIADILAAEGLGPVG